MSDILYLEYNKIVQDYLLTNDINDFGKYEFGINPANLKPIFERWDYNISQPIFNIHKTEQKISTLEAKFNILESKINSSSTLTQRLTDSENRILKLEQILTDSENRILKLEQILTKFKDINEIQPKPFTLTLPKPKILVKPKPNNL
jgi:DNA mismatch repair ATPase MutS